MDMLRIIFDSARDRHFSQVILNGWYFSPEEDVVDTFFGWSACLSTDLFKNYGKSIPNREHDYLGMYMLYI